MLASLIPFLNRWNYHRKEQNVFCSWIDTFSCSNDLRSFLCSNLSMICLYHYRYVHTYDLLNSSMKPKCYLPFSYRFCSNYKWPSNVLVMLNSMRHVIIYHNSNYNASMGIRNLSSHISIPFDMKKAVVLRSVRIWHYTTKNMWRIINDKIVFNAWINERRAYEFATYDKPSFNRIWRS